MRGLPRQEDEYDRLESHAVAERMAFFHGISQLFNQLGVDWKPDAPLQLCICGKQGAGKSTLLEYLLRVDGIAFKKQGVGTKRPVVYTVRSSLPDGSVPTEISYEFREWASDNYQATTKEELSELLRVANLDFTENPAYVRVTAPCGFDVVVSDMPGFQATKDSNKHYRMIQQINMKYLSNESCLVIYVRKAEEWEVDEDPGFDLLCDQIDHGLQRTVIVSNRTVGFLRGLDNDDTMEAEKFLAAKGQLPQSVPLFFVDFETYNDGGKLATQPVTATGDVESYLIACQEKLYGVLQDRFPQLAPKYKKAIGTKRLGDFVRKAVLSNFNGLANELKYVLVKVEKDLDEQLKTCTRHDSVDVARQNFVHWLQEQLSKVMEHGLLANHSGSDYVSLQEFTDWPSQGSSLEVTTKVKEITEADGGVRAGGALWLTYVDTILPAAIRGAEAELITTAQLASLQGAFMSSVMPCDPRMAALAHTKGK